MQMSLLLPPALIPTKILPAEPQKGLLTPNSGPTAALGPATKGPAAAAEPFNCIMGRNTPFPPKFWLLREFRGIALCLGRVSGATCSLGKVLERKPPEAGLARGEPL